MIIETVVTTLNGTGEVNFAAMGVRWGEETIVIRPFSNTRTYRNLTTSGEAVVNITDNVLIFAKSALSTARFESRPAGRVRGAVLQDACHWREVAVTAVPAPSRSGTPSRVEVVTRVVGGGAIRPFVGLCRAKHAVVEASIVASRVRWLPRQEVLDALDRLDPLVAKTGGEQEREAMAFIRAYLARRLDPPEQ
jgi:hypothetical protein